MASASPPPHQPPRGPAPPRPRRVTPLALILALTLAAHLPARADDGDAATPDSAAAAPSTTSAARLRAINRHAGAAVLGARDAFVAALSPFDRQARVGADDAVDVATYLAHARAQALDWPPEDAARLRAATDRLWPLIAPLDLRLPHPIDVILTTGDEEGDAPHTRAQAIVLPAAFVRAAPVETLARVLAHELFHVYSRHNPALRDALYATAGFHPCPGLTRPAALAPLAITNPDAPTLTHVMTVSLDGAAIEVTPFLYSAAATLAPGETFFDHMTIRLLRVTRDEARCAPTLDDAGAPVLLKFQDVSGLEDAVGPTTHLIHPEELLAERFTQLVFDDEAADPDRRARLRAVLEAARRD